MLLGLRQFLARDIAAGVMAPPLGACSSERLPSYEEAVAEGARSIAARDSHGAARLLKLVRQSTLAASSHNTQPWTFAIEERAITIRPDFRRRCPVVDPDDHHLFVSLGCATENLALAALASGLHAEVDRQPDRIRVTLEETAAVQSVLSEAIPHRQCSRSVYDGRPLSSTDLTALQLAARSDHIEVTFLTERPQIETVLEYVAAGNVAQIGDPAFVRELTSWIRFSEAEAVRAGDGLFSRSTGNPAVPRWLGNLFVAALLTPRSENEKCATQLRSSAGVAVFASRNDHRHWIDVGRSYERFALQATALGIRTAFLNQPVEVGPLRSQFAAWLLLGDRRPDLVVRFGRGPEMPRSLRRPVEQVLT
jgi:hypothetical protein